MQQKWPLDVTVSFDPYFGEPGRDGIQGAEVLPDGKVHFRIIAKDAKEVVIDRFGTLFPLSPVRTAPGKAPLTWEPDSCISS